MSQFVPAYRVYDGSAGRGKLISSRGLKVMPRCDSILVTPVRKRVFAPARSQDHDIIDVPRNADLGLGAFGRGGSREHGAGNRIAVASVRSELSLAQ